MGKNRMRMPVRARTSGPCCERCGCRLDPGEGRYCDECLEEMRQGRQTSLQTKEQEKESVYYA